MRFFFQRLDAKMHELGVSGSWLANEVGVSPMAVSNWRNGNSEPRAETLPRLANALGTTVEFLRDGIPDPNQSGRSRQARSFDEVLLELHALAAEKMNVPTSKVRIMIQLDMP